MAVLSDFFVSAEADALKYAPAAETDGFPDRVQFKGITNLELGMLWAIINGEEFDFEKHDLELLGPEGETWLCRFPSALVERLAALTPKAMKSAARVWAETE